MKVEQALLSVETSVIKTAQTVVNDMSHKLFRTWRFQRDQAATVSSLMPFPEQDSEREDTPTPTPEPELVLASEPEVIESKVPEVFDQLMENIGNDPMFPLLLPGGSFDWDSFIPLAGCPDPGLDYMAVSSVPGHAGPADSAYFTSSVGDLGSAAGWERSESYSS